MGAKKCYYYICKGQRLATLTTKPYYARQGKVIMANPKATTPSKQVFCSVCGKPLKRANSVANQCGTLCGKLAKMGVTQTVMAKHLASLQATPAQVANIGNMVKVATVHKTCKALGVPVAHMVTAFGRDKVIYTPFAGWQVVYVGKVRYLPAKCNTKAFIMQTLVGAPYMQAKAAQTINPNLTKLIAQAKKAKA